MRVVHSVLAASAACAAAVIFGPGCQDPTQVTLDVRIASGHCSEVHGTAIDVGVQPLDTEEKVKSRFPSALTHDCDLATSHIGTLVVTPAGSDEDQASIIVVASYVAGRDPTDCQPPDYNGCVVARRRFTFVQNRRLTLPITLDPTCLNIPCDAFSTCRQGYCFAADTKTCEEGDCLEPGATGDGGTNVDASVAPNATIPDGPAPVAACEGTKLRCGNEPCTSGTVCCQTQQGAVCRTACGVQLQLCCSPNDCGGATCNALPQAPRGNPEGGGPDTGPDGPDDVALPDMGTTSSTSSSGVPFDGSTSSSGGTSASGGTSSSGTIVKDSGSTEDSGTDASQSPTVGICVR